MKGKTTMLTTETIAQRAREWPSGSGADLEHELPISPRSHACRGAGAGQRAGQRRAVLGDGGRVPGRLVAGGCLDQHHRLREPRMRASRQPPAPPWNMPPIWIIASCLDEARTPRDVWAKAAHLLMGWAQGKPVDRMAALSMCEAADEMAFDPELGGYHPELGGYSPDVLTT